MKTCRYPLRLIVVLLIAVSSARVTASEPSPAVAAALARASANRAQIERALKETPANQQEGMQFLVVNMPERDLQRLSAEFLRENVALAYRAWNEAPWKERVAKELFLGEVLPYASVNEHRDDWRKDFYERCKPLVKDAKSPGQAAVVLNQKIFDLFKVHYSTKRNKADQGPHESLATGLASCTGLSVLLIDACRAVGVPARFVGVPLWADDSGNHSWVEVWDDGWHFTGAAEPAGDMLDQAWFVGKAAAAQRDSRLRAIYAASFRRTPASFPLVWAPEIDDVFAVNVTDRYTRHPEPIPAGSVRVELRVLARPGGERVAAKLKIQRPSGEIVFEGTTNDERFDANDHLAAVVKADEKYKVEASYEGRTATAELDTSKPIRLLTILLEATDRTH